MTQPVGPAPKKAGRPKGSVNSKALTASQAKGAAKAGMLALTHKLLSGRGDQLIEAVIRKALDPTDKDQAAMLKLCFDRMAPVSAFEKADHGSRPTIELRVTVAAPTESLAPSGQKSAGGQALIGLVPHIVDVVDVEGKEVQEIVQDEPTV